MIFSQLRLVPLLQIAVKESAAEATSGKKKRTVTVEDSAADIDL